jgi:putative transposase
VGTLADEGLRVPTQEAREATVGRGRMSGDVSDPARRVVGVRFPVRHLPQRTDPEMLNVIDEFIREALAIEVDHSIDADHVVAVLDRLAIARGAALVYVRFDHGPEFVAHAVADWCRFAGTASVFIDPGSP